MLFSDDQILVVVDVETTGLSASFGDRICEVGIVRARGDAVLDTYQTLVNPQRPISPGAASVNGLSDEEVSLAPRFAEIAGAVLERIDGAALVCHNAPFDLGFLDEEFSRLGLPWQPASVIDTLEIARRYFSYPSNSLSALAARLGIENVQAHRALGDALTTLQVFVHFSRLLAGRGLHPEQELARDYHPATKQIDYAVLPPEIQEALAGNEDLLITYIDADGEETSRTITPLRVREANGIVYLVSYCHLRKAERSFRLDRIFSVGRME
jgi:DNA polymerase III epsilon subunit